jgi:hypothetical protein
MCRYVTGAKVVKQPASQFAAGTWMVSLGGLKSRTRAEAKLRKGA